MACVSYIFASSSGGVTAKRVQNQHVVFGKS